MVEFVQAHRELALIGFSGAVVSVPILIGYLLGHIPKRVALILLGSILFFSSVSMSIILSLSHRSPSLTQFILSLAFGAVWIVSALNLFKPSVSPMVHSHFLKKIRWMFLVFGVTWITITIYQYVYQT